MLKVVRDHPLLSFFTLTFLLSWAIWIPMAMNYYGAFPIKMDQGFVLVFRLFGTLGPAISAIAISLILGGKSSAGALLGQIGKWRLHWKWYVAATVVFPALALIVTAIYRLIPGMQPIPVVEATAGNTIAIMIILTVSVLGEEIGWRGFALPRMQRDWTALKASLVLGTVWTAWHLPFWAVLGEQDTFGLGYWLMGWVFITAGSIYITWLMNNTGNSLLMVLLFHWCYNVLVVGFLPISSSVPAYAIMIVLTAGIALLLLSPYGKKLGWKTYGDQYKILVEPIKNK